MTRTRVTTLAALVALAPVLVACGGDDALSAKEFRAKADALCKKADADTDAIGKDLDSSSNEKDVTAAIDKLVARTNRLADDIEKLKAPEKLQSGVDTMLKDLRSGLKKIDDATVAELNAMQVNPLSKADADATKIGLKECGS